MTEQIATLNGNRLASISLYLPNVGPWFADCDLEEANEIQNPITIEWGTLRLTGSLVAGHTGTFGLQRRARVVAGAGGWSQSVSPKAYHNDAGVKAYDVARDAAAAVGERLGEFADRTRRMGADYVRSAGPASRVLEEAADGVAWWVDAAGVTHVAERAASSVAESAYDLLGFNPVTRLAELAVDDPGLLSIGGILSNERLGQPETIREIEFTLTPERVRALAWCGGSVASPARLPALLKSIVQRATDDRLFGRWRYRVIDMAGDRVRLQAISKAAGLPDILPISMTPGVAGCHAELAPGAEVRVEFVEGDRSKPEITGFAGKDGVGHVPTLLHLCNGVAPVARVGDWVQITLPIGTVIAGAGAVVAGGSGTISVALTVPVALVGFIQSGAGKVQA